MTRIRLGLVWGVLGALGAASAGAAGFTEDFNIWPNPDWTQHGGTNIDVNQTYPGAVYAHGARDFSPAARITHAQTTGTGDFEASFDLRVHDYSGNGRVYVGWMNIDEYGSVQDHDTMQDLYGWHMHSSDGTPASGVWLNISSAEGGAIQLTATQEGVQYDWDVSYAGLNDGNLYRVTFGRSADQGYLSVFDVDANELAGPDVAINVPEGAIYDFFHISTIDNKANNWWADFEIDNLSLVPEPATMLLLGLGAIALYGRRRR
jgi:hypothetical protein